ncbi:MAG: alpha-mannosidase [Anaerolineaceae bacterium]|nr:alpha-mannosidase [Anaerolineaceae bacterium]
MPDFIPYTLHQLDHALALLQGAIYTVVAPLEIRAWRTREPVPYARRTEGRQLNLKVGDRWGELFDCAWFRFTGQVPPEAVGQPVVALLDVSGEMCVFDDNGVPVRGLTNVASEYDYSLGRPGKHVLPLLACAQGGETVQVWADAGCNDLFGRVRNNGAIQEAYLAVCNEETRRLFFDYEVLLDSLKALPEKSARREQILVGLNDAVHLLWSGFSPEAVLAARRRLAPLLAQRGGEPALKVSAVGHAHMDLGWLWPIRETHRKGARTFCTALANMELYPDYVFAASQAQYFAWMKEDHPVLYEKIRRKVAEGRLEPQGALWVECDTNLTGGESLVRQILYGRRFFQAEFGVDPLYIWLPDAFGYSGALPQIMKKAGLKYFSTQKLSWSLINRFPYQSFHWQGIDGSQVLVHMLPEETYNSPAAPRSLGKIEENYTDKGVSTRALMVYGIGDGGGGPGEEHLERLARLRNFAGLPPVKQEWTAAFLEDWAAEAERFKTWAGELYLERHEGTLTTSARSKWYNRRMEQALRELEWTAAMATLSGGEYPAERLEAIWKEVLLYQFHDILPGSSIKRVYDESLPRYAALLEEVEGLTAQAQAALTGQPGGKSVVFNSLNWARSEWLRLDSGWRKVTAPPMGWAEVGEPAAEAPTTLSAAPDCLENDLLRAAFDASGGLCSLVEKKTGREVIPPGEPANRLLVFTDHGDAWDFPMDYAQSQPRPMELVSSTARTDGPRAILEQTYRLGISTLALEISLTAGCPRLEFSARLDWRETRTMLRAFFPAAVRADQAAYEIQFGHLFRPTHANTTWDQARDETCGHKWVDLSERGFGLALLNDSKYGHRIKGHTLELDLLRSVPYPGTRVVRDEDVTPGDYHGAYTDQAEHRFRYALYPHQGDLVEGQVLRQAYEFNLPLRVAEAGPQVAGEYSSMQVDAPNVIIETVKRAEDGQELIVRLYEAAGMTTDAALRFGFPVSRAAEVDLMEQPLRELALQTGTVQLSLRPFEIFSLRLTA